MLPPHPRNVGRDIAQEGNAIDNIIACSPDREPLLTSSTMSISSPNKGGIGGPVANIRTSGRSSANSSFSFPSDPSKTTFP